MTRSPMDKFVFYIGFTCTIAFPDFDSLISGGAVSAFVPCPDTSITPSAVNVLPLISGAKLRIVCEVFLKNSLKEFISFKSFAYGFFET